MEFDPACVAAHALWDLANLKDWLLFRKALRNPGFEQQKKLRGYLTTNADTAFGKEYGFGAIRNYNDFKNRVPLSDYEGLGPWFDRVHQGEEKILTREKITHFVPTSGSRSARKKIPFTKGLQDEFQKAIGPWLLDLHLRMPGIVTGPAYWSITPALSSGDFEGVGDLESFGDDTAYLGGTERWLASKVMALPDGMQGLQSPEAFRYLTLLGLLRCSSLRLISIWHPSFLALLLEALPRFWDQLLRDIESGSNEHVATLAPDKQKAWMFRPAPSRAHFLRALDPGNPAKFWPHLRLISCWKDGSAGLAAENLQRIFTGVCIQSKGLLATEAFVSIPFERQMPLAIRSHFFEFLDECGNVFLAEDLRAGGEYEVVVTTAGGLWRYRLGDRIVVTGFVGKTPTIRFLSRGESVSDRFGEKLSEDFVMESVREVFREKTPPRFVLLAPDENGGGCRYTLYFEGECPETLAVDFERTLSCNPHYAWCRSLGQLQALRVFRINERGYEDFLKKRARPGTRWGEIKPAVLSKISGWSGVFSGTYLQ